MTEARFYEADGKNARCLLCPHGCVIQDGKTGLCGARRNTDGILYAESYGRISGIALDPVFKKPLRHFYPGQNILSVGSYGCNLFCPFCQNSEISQKMPKTEYISPERLVETAKNISGNIGIAFTYNEPLIGIEYILDTAPLAQKAGLKTVLVTNMTVLKEPLTELLPYIDAMNIDVKGFTSHFYEKLGGNFENVKRNVELCAKCCHIEITTLIVPEENDTSGEMENLTRWLSGISTDIPFHITRFFPRFKMTDKTATPVKTLYALKEIAAHNLKYVYIGNLD